MKKKCKGCISYVHGKCIENECLYTIRKCKWHYLGLGRGHVYCEFCGQKYKEAEK